MATYYIDPSQSSNGTGTEESPFNSFPTTLTPYTNGDVFKFKRGTIYRVSWTSGDLFTINREVSISSYGTGNLPVISASYSVGSGGRLFRVFNGNFSCSFLRFENCFNCSPIYVQSGLNNIRVTDCEFYNIRGGISDNAISIGAGGACTQVYVLRNSLNNISNDGILVYCSDYSEIAYNRVIHPSIDAENGDCIAVATACTFLWIHNNYLDHTNKGTKQCIIQDGGSVGYAIIENNFCNGYFKADGEHTGIYCSLPGEIRKNYVKTWGSGIFQNVTAGMRISGNLVIQGGGRASNGAIHSTASSNWKVFNNTIVRLDIGTDVSDAAIRNTNSDASIEIKNNIINNFTTSILKGAASVESNNEINLPLSSFYFVLPSSSAIAAGAYLGSLQDNNSTTYWNLPTIGAFEYIRPRTMRS